MSKEVVFACPSCGASLSADSGASSVQCQFCGNTAAVPAALRDSAPAYKPTAYAPPAAASGFGFGFAFRRLAVFTPEPADHEFLRGHGSPVSCVNSASEMGRREQIAAG